MEKLEIIVPTNLGDLNLLQYQEILKIHEDPDNEIKIFSIVTGVPTNLAENVKGDIVIKTANAVKIMLSKETYPLLTRFTMDGLEFGFIPDMEGSMSYAEYVDLDTYFVEGIDQLHKLMAVAYRPIVEVDKKRNKYTIVDYVDTREYAEAMKLMPLDAALGAHSFFIELGKELLKTIPSCLENQTATNHQQSEHLDRDGDIIPLSTNSLEEISSTIKQLETSTIKKH